MDEQTPDHRSYVDQIRVTYRQIVGPWSDEERATIAQLDLIIPSPPGGVDLDALRPAVEQVAGSPDFMLEQKVNHHSWGADGVVAEYVLAAAASGVIGSAAWASLVALGRALAKLGNSGDAPSRPIGEREAKGWARQLALRRFDDLSDGELGDAVSVELREANATVKFNALDGSTVTVELELIDGLITLGAARRDHT